MNSNKKPLTVKTIESGIKQAKSTGKPVRLSDGVVSGLIVRISPTGYASFYLHTRKNGRIVKNSLGAYPSLSLVEAREKASQSLRHYLETGESPKDKGDREKKELEALKKERLKASLTMANLLDEWIGYQVSTGRWKSKRQAQRERARIVKHSTPILDKPLLTVTPRDIVTILNPLYEKSDATKGGTATAEKLRGHYSTFFNWCVSVKELLPVGFNPSSSGLLNPLLIAPKSRAETRNQPALDMDQLRILWSRLKALNTVPALMLMFGILTASRASPLRFMRWDELTDDKEKIGNPDTWQYWKIPSEKMKTDKPHTVPLSDEALNILRKLWTIRTDSPYVFLTQRGKTFSDQYPRKVIVDLDAIETAKGREGFLDRTQSREKGERTVANAHGVCRACIRTWGEEQKMNQTALELILAHKVDKVFNGAYNRAEMLDERLSILEQWAKALDD